jgi:hypothetical protein
VPTHDDVKDLPYLRAVIDEGLRYYATMSTGLPRLVPEGGAVFGGVYIPEGVSYSSTFYTEHLLMIANPSMRYPSQLTQSSMMPQYGETQRSSVLNGGWNLKTSEDIFTNIS